MDRKPPRVQIGVLGGMGPRATHYFLGELLQSVERLWKPQKDQDYPDLHVRYACFLPDRTASFEGDPQPFLKVFQRELEMLVDLGCNPIVIPCITAHAALDALNSAFPVIDIRRLVAEFVDRQWTNARIGLLATRGSRITGVTSKFSEDPNRIISLDAENEDALMRFVYGEAKAAKVVGPPTSLLRIVDSLQQRGADIIIAGCTEVEMHLSPFLSDNPQIVFPLRLVASTLADLFHRTSSNNAVSPVRRCPS